MKPNVPPHSDSVWQRRKAPVVTCLLFAVLGCPVDSRRSAARQIPEHSAAATEGDACLAERVDALVRQLGAVRLADREAAESELLQLGPRVLVMLPQEAGLLPAEVVERVDRIRRQLQWQAAASITEAALVKLSVKAKPIGEVLAAISEQTGNRIVFPAEEFAPGDPPRVDVELDGVPFWQALDAVLDQSGLGADVLGGERAVYVVRQKKGARPRSSAACYRGPFRIAPADLTAEGPAGEPALAPATVYLELAWEPRLAPIELTVPLARFELRDDHGNTLPRSSVQPHLALPVFAQTTAVKIPVRVQPPPGDMRQVALLRGSFQALLPGKPHAFRFPDLSRALGTEQRVAMATVRLDDVRSSGSRWECRLRVRFDRAGGALQSHLTWVSDNNAYLLDAAGRIVPWQSFETTLQEENQVGSAYWFELADGPEQYTFVYETPVLFVEKTIDFELHNIPLP